MRNCGPVNQAVKKKRVINSTITLIAQDTRLDSAFINAILWMNNHTCQ
jgi:hypothetical protein